MIAAAQTPPAGQMPSQVGKRPSLHGAASGRVVVVTTVVLVVLVVGSGQRIPRGWGPQRKISLLPGRARITSCWRIGTTSGPCRHHHAPQVSAKTNLQDPLHS